jgi:hypothetical protein
MHLQLTSGDFDEQTAEGSSLLPKTPQYAILHAPSTPVHVH